MGESEVGGEAGAGGLDGISDTCSCCSAREFAPSKGLVLSLRGGGGGAPQSSAAGNVTYVPSCTSGLRRSVPEVGVWHRDEQSPRNLTNEP